MVWRPVLVLSVLLSLVVPRELSYAQSMPVKRMSAQEAFERLGYLIVASTSDLDLYKPEPLARGNEWVPAGTHLVPVAIATPEEILNFIRITKWRIHPAGLVFYKAVAE
jgi:hypothetical protein